ncbi:type VI secretion system contractile sheath large subunit [Shewanella sp. VB17]|nr:type VI secretion system contractile sheath large subunit [Shewanella sp. VB17]
MTNAKTIISRLLLTENQSEERYSPPIIESVGQLKLVLIRLIAKLDLLISEQLSEVIQHPCFKQLEASWLEVSSLISLPVSQRRVRIKILDAKWEEVSEDLNTFFDLKYCVLFKKLYSDEFDMAGGTPFGLLVLAHKIASSYEESQHFEDLYTLQLLSELCEMAFCPAILGIDEYFLGDNQKHILSDSLRVKRILQSDDFSSWLLLRDRVTSRFIHLVLPEYLLRKPYEHYTAGFMFSESQSDSHCLWGNSAFLLASNVIREFDRVSWFGFLRSYDNSKNSGAIVSQSENVVTKVDIHSEEDGFWSEQGFIALSSIYLSGQKGFFSNSSVWKTPDDTAHLQGMLQTNLMACRLGHYIKVQLRELVGLYDSAAACQHRLSEWLQYYTNTVQFADDSLLARYPLKSFEVHIKESPNDKTRYMCKFILQPQNQFGMMDAKLILETSILRHKSD